MYAKSLAKSVVNKQTRKPTIQVVAEAEAQVAAERSRSRDQEPKEETAEVGEDEKVEEEETSLWCGDEEAKTQQEVAEPVLDNSEETEDEDVVVDTRNRRRQPRARRIVSDSEEDESEMSEPQPAAYFRQPKLNVPELKPTAPTQKSANITSMRPLHRKGSSTISNWAQEVIDLSDSPEAPTSFVLSQPTHVRSSSFAATSRPTSSASNAPLAILTYSPTPTKKRSPCKAPPVSRPGTPPLGPPSPIKLV